MALQQEVMERMQAETTLRAAQDELVQAGKLAVIGQLSTEVAHELNQPLAALRALAGNSQRFLERGQSEMVQSNLQRMAELTERMGRITGQLRNLPASPPASPSRLNWPRWSMALCPHGAAHCPKRRHDRATALGSRAERLVRCQSRTAGVDQSVEQCAGRRAGRQYAVRGNCLQPLRCLGADHGARSWSRTQRSGASATVRAFFTTKPEGLGLGLGLPLSAEIAQAAGGSLTGGNHPEGGAIFTLSLPLVDTRPLS
jgi:two-component system C4-dicarboxylate transport sensor histidine kinase DctB